MGVNVLNSWVVALTEKRIETVTSCHLSRVEATVTFKNPALIAYLLSLPSSKVAMATRVQQRGGGHCALPQSHWSKCAWQVGRIVCPLTRRGFTKGEEERGGGGVADSIDPR